MKELTIEEKSKRYDEALEAIKSLQEVNPSDEGIQNWVNENFPELAESEDERIRKVLIDYFNRYKEQEECGIDTFFGIPTDNILAWLEKQVQKPTDEEMKEALRTEYEKGRADTIAEMQKEWSEKDEKILNSLISSLARIGASTRTDSTSINYTFSKEIDWLKSLKDRVGCEANIL